MQNYVQRLTVAFQFLFIGIGKCIYTFIADKSKNFQQGTDYLLFLKQNTVLSMPFLYLVSFLKVIQIKIPFLGLKYALKLFYIVFEIILVFSGIHYYLSVFHGIPGC